MDVRHDFHLDDPRDPGVPPAPVEQPPIEEPSDPAPPREEPHPDGTDPSPSRTPIIA